MSSVQLAMLFYHYIQFSIGMLLYEVELVSSFESEIYSGEL